MFKKSISSFLLLGLFYQPIYLMASDPSFIFETQNLKVRLLNSQDFEGVKKIQNSDKTEYISAAPEEDLKESLKKQDQLSNAELKNALKEIGGIGIGLFLKSNQRLIGMATLEVKKTLETENSKEKSVSPCLETSLRLLKESRGKGYGTKHKNGLIQYLTKNALIPTHKAGFSEKTPYWGLSGLVDFKNKASLGANMKCNYGIFELLGNIINVYYPRNETAEKARDEDVDLFSIFKNYLSKDEKVSRSGEKDLILYSLKRFANGRKPLQIADGIELSMPWGPYENTSTSLAFVVNAIHDFPDVFEKLQAEEKAFFNEKFITEDSRAILKTGNDPYEEVSEEVKSAEKNLNELLNLKN